MNYLYYLLPKYYRYYRYLPLPAPGVALSFNRLTRFAQRIFIAQHSAFFLRLDQKKRWIFRLLSNNSIGNEPLFRNFTIFFPFGAKRIHQNGSRFTSLHGQACRAGRKVNFQR